MKKITCIIGTRPQLIKHSVLLKELKKQFKVQTLDTLQHQQFELNERLRQELCMDESYDKITIQPELAPAERLGKMIIEIAGFINKTNTSCLLVYGDTDTTLAGALAANKAKIPLIHVEAGERSLNRYMPEEHNRIITDQLADVHFCSSNEAIHHLKSENRKDKVFYSGDVMKDLLIQTSQTLECSPAKGYFFCTIHRNYNKNNPAKLKELLEVLDTLDKPVFFSVHPATLQALSHHKIDTAQFQNIKLLPPLSYSESINYQKFSDAVITDSGGVQKEAYWLKRPCITVRKETEWKATLEGKWNQLIYEELKRLPDLLKEVPDEIAYNRELYGNGKASTIITETLSTLI